MRYSGSRGFTLLEAIVALSMFSAGSMALYGWYSTVMIGLVRAEEQLEVAEFMRNVDAYLGTLNLQGEVDGSYAANGFTADWSATLVEPKKEGTNIAGQIGYYRIGLYNVDIDVFRDDTGARVENLTTRLVGYEGVRVPNIEVE